MVFPQMQIHIYICLLLFRKTRFFLGRNGITQNISISKHLANVKMSSWMCAGVIQQFILTASVGVKAYHS